ncbi:MAG TPA: RNA polymerase sigma factor [Acidimicrobiales bacterium]|nr:RNA polymerase sigma factor [Acidimicrobiales bacterium]
MDEVVVRLDCDDFVAMYRAEYHRVVRALELAGAGRPTAEDVAQEAFARTLARWRRVRGGTNPAGYVYRVAFRQWSRQCRDGDRPDPSPGAVQSADATAENAATHADVEHALAAMPLRRRTCAVLCLVIGYTPTEAGEVMRIKASTVRKHLDQARADLTRSVETIA